MCISAPTGSGKTLAYVVPIVQTLMKRDTTQLSAIVLLPSRELAVQAHKVFEDVAEGTRVKTTIITGQRPFAQEQEALVGRNVSHPYNPLSKVSTSTFQPCYKRDSGVGSLLKVNPGPSGCSQVDVLVCTPGRLLDHLEYTSGFTLQHVRFLVLDEADRLLNNSYHNWVRDLVSSIDSLPGTTGGKHERMTAPSRAVLQRRPSVPLQRLLFSATLTDNPAKLALLNVADPLILRCAAADPGVAGGGGEEDKDGSGEAGGVFTLPAGLSEAMSVCTTAKRPMLLASLLAESFEKAGGAKEDEAEPEAEAGNSRGPSSPHRPPATDESAPGAGQMRGDRLHHLR